MGGIRFFDMIYIDIFFLVLIFFFPFFSFILCVSVQLISDPIFPLSFPLFLFYFFLLKFYLKKDDIFLECGENYTYINWCRKTQFRWKVCKKKEKNGFLSFT